MTLKSQDDKDENEPFPKPEVSFAISPTGIRIMHSSPTANRSMDDIQIFTHLQEPEPLPQYEH